MAGLRVHPQLALYVVVSHQVAVHVPFKGELFMVGESEAGAVLVSTEVCWVVMDVETQTQYY